VIDSETHFCSVSSSRDVDIGWHNGHSSSLVAAAFGLCLRSSWFWTRKTNSTLVSSSAARSHAWRGSVSAAGAERMQAAYIAGTAPKAVAAPLGKGTGGLRGASAAACILRCEDSRCHMADWAVATLESFTGLALASTRAQLFVTDRPLDEGGAEAFASCGTIMVPACGFAADAVVQAVG
jgi:hypothetical protein